MLKRFFKHDGASLLRVLWPIAVAMIGCSIISTCLNALTISLAETQYTTLVVLLSSSQAFFLLGTSVLMVVGLFFVFFSFYRSMFTDEGYLTLVLPVGTHTLLLSKLCVGAVFYIGIYAVWMLTTVLSYLPSVLMLAEEFELSADLLEFDFLYTVGDFLHTVSSFMIVYAAITLGAVFFHRHKIFGSFLFAFALFIGQSLIDAIILLIFFGTPVLDTVALLLQMLLSIGVSVLLYLLMVHLIRNKLNLI